MQMDTRIPLMGQQPDFVNTLARSTQAAQLANQNRDQNALRQLFQAQGPQIMAGEGNALNALAQIDPNAALGIKSTQQDMTIQRERLGLAREASAREAARYAMDLEEGQRQKIKEATSALLSMLSLAKTPEQFEQAKQRAAAKYSFLDMSQYTFDDLPMVVAELEGTAAGVDLVERRHPKPSTEAEREIARLVGLGIEPDVAVKIKEGVYKLATDPQTGLHTIIDLSTGGPVSGSQRPTAEPPQATPPEPEGYRFGEQFQSPSTSFGLGGAARGVVNTLVDSAGLPVPFAETQQTQSDFGVLREQLINDISSGYNRQPPSWLLKNIEALTPQAGSPFQGAEGAKTKLKAIGRSLDGEAKNIRRQLQRPMRETSRQELEAKLSGLESALSRVDAALSSFDKDEGGNVTSNGVKWKVVE